MKLTLRLKKPMSGFISNYSITVQKCLLFLKQEFSTKDLLLTQALLPVQPGDVEQEGDPIASQRGAHAFIVEDGVHTSSLINSREMKGDTGVPVT